MHNTKLIWRETSAHNDYSPENQGMKMEGTFNYFNF